MAKILSLTFAGLTLITCAIFAFSSTGSDSSTVEDISMESKRSHLEGINPNTIDWKSKDEVYWKEVLTSEQFEVCRQAGTERPFSGKYCHFKGPGMFTCACCGLKLFDAEAKFDSGTGWPSFSEAVDKGAVITRTDNSHGMIRTEVLCGRCGAHLGHAFDDGPAPSGKRFCINSICLLHQPH